MEDQYGQWHLINSTEQISLSQNNRSPACHHYPCFMDNEDSLPCSQELNTSLYSEPDQSRRNPHKHNGIKKIKSGVNIALNDECRFIKHQYVCSKYQKTHFQQNSKILRAVTHIIHPNRHSVAFYWVINYSSHFCVGKRNLGLNA